MTRGYPDLCVTKKDKKKKSEWRGGLASKKKNLMADDDDVCSVCRKQLDFIVDSPIHHTKCGHFACAGTCSDGKNESCDTCINVASVQSRQPGQLVVYPPPPTQTGVFAGLYNMAHVASINLRNRHETPDTSTDLHWLVGLGPARVPVALLLRKKFDFNRCVQKGITMDDFLRCGYSIGDLAGFPEVTPQLASDGITPLGVQALQALKTTASHFRQYPSALPMEAVRQLTGLTNKHLVEQFYLRFHPVSGIMSPRANMPPDTEWTIDQLRYMGFSTMAQFIEELGLRKVSHYWALNPGEREVQLLGVTARHMKYLENDVKPPPPPPEPAVVVAAASAPVVRISHAGPDAWVVPVDPTQPKYSMRIERDGTKTITPMVDEQRHASMQSRAVTRIGFDAD